MCKARTIGAALAAMAAASLGGCSSDFYDARMKGFTPELPEQTYPIEVAKGAVRLEVAPTGARLTADEETAVRRLAGQAMSHRSPVLVSRPAGSVNAEVVAARITRLLTEAGIDPMRIRNVAHPGGGPVTVSFRRKFAVTRECGDWSKPAVETADNRLPPNFGCSQQHNIAAMVDNPEDFERPRLMTPPDAENRVSAINKYRARQDYNSSQSNQAKAKVSDSKSGN